VWARTFSCRPCPRCGSPGKERQRRLLEGTAGREPHRATAAGVSGSLVRKNDWLAAERDPRFKRPYTELSYQPMIELLAYLRTGALATRSTTTSPGRYAGMDNGWALSLIQPVIIEFDKSIVDFPNIKRIAGGPPTIRFRIFRIRQILCRRWI